MARTSSYEAREETKDQAHSNAVRELSKSRNRLKDALSGVEGMNVPPYRTLVNPQPPRPSDRQGGMARPPWGDDLRLCHAATVEFWREVAPYKHHAPGKWTEELATVKRPSVDGEAILKQPHQHPDIHVSELDYTKETVSLETLGDWCFNEVTLWCECDRRWSQSVRVSRREKVHLPVIASNEVYQQLNDILDEISMLAEIREASAADNDPGKPNDVDVWQEVENGE